MMKSGHAIIHTLVEALILTPIACLIVRSVYAVYNNVGHMLISGHIHHCLTGSTHVLLDDLFIPVYAYLQHPTVTLHQLF